MYKLLYIFFILFFVEGNNAAAQSFAINTDGSTANASALLDVKSTAKGILIPRMTKAQKNAIASPATGLLVFQNAPDSVGFQYYDGTKWLWLAASNSVDTIAWKTNGNTGTNSTNHYFGTTDNIALSFRQNNKWIGRLDATNKNYFIGAASGVLNTGGNNVAFGDSAFSKATTGFSNVAIGVSALNKNQTGNNLVAIGDSALFNLTPSGATGIRNTAVGSKALSNTTTGNQNTALGFQALKNNTVADFNTAVGSLALNGNQTGTNNTAIGNASMATYIFSNNIIAIGDSAAYKFSGGSADGGIFIGKNAGRNYKNTGQGTGSVIIGENAGDSSMNFFSVVIGKDAGRLNRGGSNTFVGFGAGEITTTGNNNSFFGNRTASLNTTASNNTFIGSNAGQNNTTGGDNTLVGRLAMPFNLLGNRNTALGSNALLFNSVGSNNVAIGYDALESNAAASFAASYTVAIGDSTLRLNGNGATNVLQGVQNTAVGSKVLAFNTIGSNNTGLGFQALLNNNQGISNTAIGSNALRNQTGSSANYNVAVGDSAAKNLLTGANNTIVGTWAFKDHTLGSRNTAIGNFALGEETNGNDNTALGEGSLWNTNNNLNTGLGVGAGFTNVNGTENCFIGANTDALSNTLTNATAIGSKARVDASNSMVLGSVNGVNGATSNVNVGIGLTSPSTSLDVEGGIRTKYSGTIVTGVTTGYQIINLSIAAVPAGWDFTNTMLVVTCVDGSSGVIYQAKLTSTTNIQLAFAGNVTALARFNYIVFKL